MKNVLIIIVLVVLGSGSAIVFIKMKNSKNVNENNKNTTICAKHQIEKSQCPFCDKSLIEKMGKCAEHGGIPEALCYQCNKALIPAFKAEGDWCSGHNVPESQCVICKGGSECKDEKK